MVCPLRADCDAVIHSEYANFFTIPLEIMGIFYYLVIFISYLFFIIFPQLITIEIKLIFLILSSFGFLFSLYLTSIQLLAIGEWCTWCLISAMCSIIIFTLSLFLTKIAFLPILENYHGLLVLIYIFATIIGLIGAVTVDILFFRFLKDAKLSMKENNIIRFLFQLVWSALALILISGSALYLLNIKELSISEIFLAKIIIIIIMIVNSALLHLYLAPKLFKMSFIEDKKILMKLVNTRKKAFMMSVISIISWCSIAILGLFLDKIDFSVSFILAIYIVLIFIAIVISQLIGYLFIKNNN